MRSRFAYAGDDAYLDALHRAFAAEDLVDDAVRECIAHADTRIDALWRAVEGAARHPTPTDLTGDFPWIMARGAARALLLRPVAGLGAEGVRLLHEPFRARKRRRPRADRGLPLSAESGKR